MVAILNFMYHGEVRHKDSCPHSNCVTVQVNVNQEDLQMFLAAAEELRIKGLSQASNDTKLEKLENSVPKMKQASGGSNSTPGQPPAKKPRESSPGEHQVAPCQTRNSVPRPLPCLHPRLRQVAGRVRGGGGAGAAPALRQAGVQTAARSARDGQQVWWRSVVLCLNCDVKPGGGRGGQPAEQPAGLPGPGPELRSAAATGPGRPEHQELGCLREQYQQLLQPAPPAWYKPHYCKHGADCWVAGSTAGQMVPSQGDKGEYWLGVASRHKAGNSVTSRHRCLVSLS